MGAEWVKFQITEGKKACKAALNVGCYDASIDYDSLAQFCKIKKGSMTGDIIPYIKEYQRQYKEEFNKTSSGIDSAMNLPINKVDAVTELLDQNKNNDVPADPGPKKKETRGRKNRGLTEKHYKEKLETRKYFRTIEQPKHFNSDIVERVCGDIVNNDDIEQYRELTQLTFDSVLDDFTANNPELVKKHPYNYYKKLLIELKKQLPKITADDVEKCNVLWDILKSFMSSIGLYITYETFEQLTNIYKYQIQNKKGVNSAFADFEQKINKDCDSALLNELQYNPYNQTNKIFIAKVRGFVEKTETKQIEVNHHVQSFDNISRYRLENNENN